MKKGLTFMIFFVMTVVTFAQGGTGDIEKIIAENTQALSRNPSDAGAYYKRGNACLGKADFDRAIADFSQTIRINPDYGPAYNSRGLAYYYKRDYARARADWNKALQLIPDNAVVRHNLEILWRKRE